MRNTFKSAILISFLASFFTITPLWSQQATIWHFTTTDGNTFTGTIISEDSAKYVIKTLALGEITIQRNMVKSKTEVSSDEMANGHIWYRNPHDTRYYFGPNSYGLRRGEGYYQNAWVFYNQVSYGISDQFSLGAGTVPLFLLRVSATPCWLTPKLSIPVVKNRFNIGAGAFVGTILGQSHSNFGILYGTGTVGPRHLNATLGVGYGYVNGEFADRPAISLSLMARVHEKFAIISENYTISTGDDQYTLISCGGRFLGKKIAIDAALVAPIANELNSFIAIPWLGINVPFGKRWKNNS